MMLRVSVCLSMRGAGIIDGVRNVVV